jgi:hypothetical protein
LAAFAHSDVREYRIGDSLAEKFAAEQCEPRYSGSSALTAIQVEI